MSVSYPRLPEAPAQADTISALELALQRPKRNPRTGWEPGFDKAIGEWMSGPWEEIAKRKNPEAYAYLKQREAQGIPVYAEEYQIAAGIDTEPGVGKMLAYAPIAGAVDWGTRAAGGGLGALLGARLGVPGAIAGGAAGFLLPKVATRFGEEALGLRPAGGGFLTEDVLLPRIASGVGGWLGRGVMKRFKKSALQGGSGVLDLLLGKGEAERLRGGLAKARGVATPKATSSPLGLPEVSGAQWTDLPWEDVSQDPLRHVRPVLAGDVPPPRSWAELPRRKVRPSTRLSYPVQEGTPPPAERGALLRSMDRLRQRRLGLPTDPLEHPDDVLGSSRGARALAEEVAMQRRAALEQLLQSAPLPPVASQTARQAAGSAPWEVYLESMLDRLAPR